MQERWAFLLGAAAAILLPNSNTAADAQTPQTYTQTPQAISRIPQTPGEQAAKNLIQTLGSQIAVAAIQEKTQREAKFAQIFATSFDASHLSQHALGIYWRDMKEQDKLEFVRLFKIYAPLRISDRLEENVPPNSQFAVTGAKTISSNIIVSSTFTASTGKSIQVDWYIDPTISSNPYNFAVAGGIVFSDAVHNDLMGIMGRNPDKSRAPAAAVRQALQNRGIQANARPAFPASDKKSGLVPVPA